MNDLPIHEREQRKANEIVDELEAIMRDKGATFPDNHRESMNIVLSFFIMKLAQLEVKYNSMVGFP